LVEFCCESWGEDFLHRELPEESLENGWSWCEWNVVLRPEH
jgi:hypothetical protein